MKLYADKPGASIKMIADEDFIKAMTGIIRSENIESVFESGTYLGNGSTTTLADLFVKNNKLPAKFVTVEANLEYHKAAKKNLEKYRFIEPVFGLSVDYLEAVRFLVNDNIFGNLDKYPDVYIDHANNPQHGYLQEIMVGVFHDRMERESRKEKKSFFNLGVKSKVSFINNTLLEYCTSNVANTSLVVLDSAAGIGFYEFLQVKQLMKGKKYYLVLDDIDHLKHFRSKQFIEDHPKEFSLVGLNRESGWLIAKGIL